LALLVGAFATFGAAPVQALERSAQLGPVTVSVVLEPDEPVIGDPMTLAIEASAEDGVEVLMPDFGEALDRFRIVDFVPRERIDGAGRTVHSQRYSFRAPASGEHLLPAILIEFVDRRPGQDPAPEDQDAYELLTDSIPFVVASVVPDSVTADLSPPMGPLGPLGTRTGPVWSWILGLVVVAAAASPFLYRAWQRFRERASMRSAYDLARDELDALLAGAKPTPDRVDGFFVELSGIVRRYLERRFALRSPELTTERFLEQVSGSPDLSASHQDLLRDFLRESDLVKFAHHIPSPEAIERATAFVRRFVDETRDDPLAAGAGPQALGA
jgi:hypothetical protein